MEGSQIADRGKGNYVTPDRRSTVRIQFSMPDYDDSATPHVSFSPIINCSGLRGNTTSNSRPVSPSSRCISRSTSGYIGGPSRMTGTSRNASLVSSRQARDGAGTTVVESNSNNSLKYFYYKISFWDYSDDTNTAAKCRVLLLILLGFQLASSLMFLVLLPASPLYEKIFDVVKIVTAIIGLLLFVPAIPRQSPIIAYAISFAFVHAGYIVAIVILLTLESGDKLTSILDEWCSGSNPIDRSQCTNIRGGVLIFKLIVSLVMMFLGGYAATGCIAPSEESTETEEEEKRETHSPDAETSWREIRRTWADEFPAIDV